MRLSLYIVCCIFYSFQGSVDVPYNLVGLVIGKQGANVKKIAASCGPGTRIDRVEGSAGSFNISASSPANVASARVGVLKAAGEFAATF